GDGQRGAIGRRGGDAGQGHRRHQAGAGSAGGRRSYRSGGRRCAGSRSRAQEGESEGKICRRRGGGQTGQSRQGVKSRQGRKDRESRQAEAREEKGRQGIASPAPAVRGSGNGGAAMRSVTLPGGESVPALGLGTWMMGERGADEPESIAALQRGI